MSDYLNDWHQSAIAVDVAVDRPLPLRQFRLKCAWCGRHYLLVVDREHADRRGYRLCDHCGQWFCYALHAPTEASMSWRVRARPKLLPPGARRPGFWRH